MRKFPNASSNLKKLCLQQVTIYEAQSQKIRTPMEKGQNQSPEGPRLSLVQVGRKKNEAHDSAI